MFRVKGRKCWLFGPAGCSQYSLTPNKILKKLRKNGGVADGGLFQHAQLEFRWDMTFVARDGNVSFDYFAFHLGQHSNESRSDTLRFFWH